MKTIWFDFTNPPHVNFFSPLIKKYENSGFHIISTAREFVETINLLKLYNIDFQQYGKHGGKSKPKKVMALLDRYWKLYTNIDNFDFSFSSNYEAPLISWIKRKPAFVFDDNDISPNWLYSKFAKFVVSPKYIDLKAMYSMGIKPTQMVMYDGFKENIYVADYKPDVDFLKKLPFEEFVTVRPENIQATYVGENVKSIVPELVAKLVNKGINILYLPRYQSDKDMLTTSERIFIPEKPLNGLDVSYYSSAVLTGAGSFSREAAVLGTPAVSFFAGNTFLGVDKEMFKQNLVYYSRQPDEIVNHVLNAKKRGLNLKVSKDVQENMFSQLDKSMNLYL
jgi:uncharacterized protein